MDKMELKALGKINLGLDVLGRRENGYHDVRMVMQTVYLYDQIVITKTKQPGVKAETNLFYLPVDENNLACRAAKMLIDEFNITEGVHISMDKKIPVSAGMAGGSADAAAVLFGVNKMFGLGLSMTELEERGGKAWRRCTILSDAWDSSGRGNRREADTSFGLSKVFCAAGKTTDQCIDEDGL